MNSIYTIVLIVALFVAPNLSYSKESEPRPIVSILTWWDYLSDDIINTVEKRCSVDVQFDEFKTNVEFFRRLNQVPYDVAIYSDNAYKKFRKIYPDTGFDLASLTENGHTPAIQRIANAFAKDTGLFQLSLTGFMHNPEKFSISRSDSIVEIFRRAKGKSILLLDEHAVIMDLIAQAGLIHNTKDEAEIFKIRALTEGTKTRFSTNLGKIADLEDFAFAYTWEGEYRKLKHTRNPELKFLVHPAVSHWSNDLVTAITNTPSSQCVAAALISKDILHKVSLFSGYISPYNHELQSGDPELDEEYNDFFHSMDNIRLPLVVQHDSFDNRQKYWNQVKVKIYNQHQWSDKYIQWSGSSGKVGDN